jgi:hypothetical protein
VRSRLRIKGRDRQQDPDHDLAESKDGLVGHDGHPEGAPEPGPVDVSACRVHAAGLRLELLRAGGRWAEVTAPAAGKSPQRLSRTVGGQYTVGPAGQSGVVDAEDDLGGLNEHRDRPTLGQAKALGGGPGDHRHDVLAGDIHGDLCHHRAERSTLLTVPLSWFRALSLTISSSVQQARDRWRSLVPSPAGRPAVDRFRTELRRRGRRGVVEGRVLLPGAPRG